MACEELKTDVNNATSFFKITFSMCVGLYNRNRICIEHLNCRNCNYTFCAEFCQTRRLLSLYSDMFRVSIVYSNALQQSDLLTNRLQLNGISGYFIYPENAINAICRLTLRHVLTESLELK